MIMILLPGPRHFVPTFGQWRLYHHNQGLICSLKISIDLLIADRVSAGLAGTALLSYE